MVLVSCFLNSEVNLTIASQLLDVLPGQAVKVLAREGVDQGALPAHAALPWQVGAQVEEQDLGLPAQDVLDDLVQDVLARGHRAHLHLHFDQVEQHAHISILVQGRPIIVLEKIEKNQGLSI